MNLKERSVALFRSVQDWGFICRHQPELTALVWQREGVG